MPSASASVERAGAHPQNKAAFGQVIEHRRLHRDQHGVHVGEVRGAGRELDLLRFRNQRGVEHHAVGDGLAGVGQMLTHEGIVEAELVGQDDGLAVLLQRVGPVPVHRVNRHGEVAQSHSVVSDLAAVRLKHIEHRQLAVMWPNLPAWHKREFTAAERASMRKSACLKAAGGPRPLGSIGPPATDFARRRRGRRDAFTAPPAP